MITICRTDNIMSISTIIPSYKNPKFLDACIHSCIKGKKNETTKIIVVVDGFIGESQHVLNKYEGGIEILDLGQNMGMDKAINYGVWNCESENIFVVNDDQIFSDNWDVDLSELNLEKTVYTIEQIERSHGIFGFTVNNFGDTVDTFNQSKFDDFVKVNKSDKSTESGRIFPFLMKKKWFMSAGGFEDFKSPFWTDVDFFLKLELMGLEFRRTYKTMLFHWGSSATKNRVDSEAIKFKSSEGPAAQLFYYKWGYMPQMGGNNYKNTKYPHSQTEVKGVIFN